MEEITREQLFAMFGEQVHDAIRKKLELNSVDGMIVFECLDMCSSNIGKCTAVVYGKGCTYPTWKSAQGKHLHDLPSQRQHARYYYQKPREKEEEKGGKT